MKEMSKKVWFYNYTKVKREFWICVAVLVISIFCAICCIKSCLSDCVSADTDMFIECIEQYEAETGRRIYPAGRQCLKNATKKCKTKEEILEIIRKEMAQQK